LLGLRRLVSRRAGQNGGVDGSDGRDSVFTMDSDVSKNWAARERFAELKQEKREQGEGEQPSGWQ
jgi:hypothetical protein